MPRSDLEVRVTPSVLDRLVDYEPRDSQEAPKTRSTSLAELKQSIRRDLEWLLNTRCHTEALDDRLVEAKRSVAFYGLPDITGVNAQNYTEQQRITKAMDAAIRFFEPRFLNLKVTMVPVNTVDRQLKFRIEASLDVEPAPEPIVFDTALQMGSGEFVIS
ncbi:MAG: type VI secretion system baseplate subunit TssE [Acidobacteriota bacterium]